MDIDDTAADLAAWAEWLGCRVWIEPSRVSVYLTVLTPAGERLTIRVSDHATVSHRHPPTDYNVAPRRDRPVEVRRAVAVRCDGPRGGAKQS